jgi:ABC-2 type transport system permease protein
MKRFLGFLRKEFYHIFRDYRSMLILFGMPLVEVLLFGYVITNEIKDINIGIYDQSNDQQTQKLTQKILSSGYFHLQKRITSNDEILDGFRKGTFKEVVIFEPGFANKLERDNTANVQILADASDANTANLITNYTMGIIRDYSRTLNADIKLPMQIVPEVRMMFNEELKGVYMFVPGIMALILMLISAMMTSITISREKEMGTMEILLVSPLRPFQIILGKVTPYFGLSFINALTILTLAYFVFGMPILGSTVFLLLESMLYILMALSLGILISTVAKQQQTAMFISMFALMMPTMLLSGFIFPVENMPLILQWVSSIIPARYYIIIIKNIMLKGTNIEFVWKETLILIGFTILFIALSIKKFKIRLE